MELCATPCYKQSRGSVAMFYMVVKTLVDIFWSLWQKCVSSYEESAAELTEPVQDRAVARAEFPLHFSGVRRAGLQRGFLGTSCFVLQISACTPCLGRRRGTQRRRRTDRRSST